MNKFRFVAKSLIHGAIDICGQSHRQRKKLRGKLIILTYHSFCVNWPPGLFNSLPVRRFERQIQFLKNNFKVVSLKQGLDYLRQGYFHDQPWVAITIDDGFLDNYTHAWPLLQHYGIPATIFLATDFIDTGRPPWPTQLTEILEHTPLRYMESPFRKDIRSLTLRSTVVQQLMKDWGSLSPEQRFTNIEVLRSELQVNRPTRHFPLTWNQIRKMRSSGVFIGSHTVYHSILPAVNDSLARMEIRESRKRIEEELQEECLDFAYPNGDFGLREKKLLQSENFRLGLTQETGINDVDSDRYSLFRIEIPYHDPLVTFRSRVSCCLQ